MSKIYVGQLSTQTTQETLQTVFAQFGEVKQVEVRVGFAFITFNNEDEVAQAIDQMNGKELDGKIIKVEKERGSAEGGFRGERQKIPKRLDLRVLIRNVHPKADWRDLKDWAREALGDITYSNVFDRDGQHMGLIECKVR